MKKQQQFDFWYAVNNTELISTPTSHLETFGDTVVNYYMLCELMDCVGKVRVREGHLKAFKPSILTPQSLGQVDVGEFGNDAKEYADWLAEHANELHILQYGFTIQKQEMREYVVTDNMENVLERVQNDTSVVEDPLSAILIGVDEPWQVCLLKLMVDLVQHSVHGNVQDIRKFSADMKQRLDNQIDLAFLEASRDSSKIKGLANILKLNGLWEKYQDRFFALVKASKQ